MTKHEFPSQGAVITDGGVRYCTWAPEKHRVEIEIAHCGSDRWTTLSLKPEAEGYYGEFDPSGGDGDRYRYRLDGEGPFPDPASRWQPDGVHGPSMVIDSHGFQWHDHEWHRTAFRDLAIYELHIGAFTSEGTFHAAIERLPYLSTLGVNAILIMPVADFPGLRNWGYDGVSLFAPARCYGHPDHLRRLVDAAHRHGLAVLLDLVYNHLGPDGNYLGQFSRFYFNPEHQTPWGSAVNFDGENNEPVRSYFVSNALYWIEQFHIDGVRLDATHEIFDDSRPHILSDISAALQGRGTYLIAEDERNLAKLISPRPNGYGLNAVYADDFCHTVQVALGDLRYNDDFSGAANELADELRHGWHYRGQMSQRHAKRVGTECEHLPPERFVFCISNHDQAGNHGLGERLHHIALPEAYRAASALLLLMPYTPLLFMGQEWAASTPFLYFTDHAGDLGRLVTEGRRKEFARFPAFRDPETRSRIPDPQSVETFERSKLKWGEIERESHAAVLSLYRECLRLRSSEQAFRAGNRENWRVDDGEVVAVRLRGSSGSWLVLVDLIGGHEAAVPADERWLSVFSTNESRFGGAGTIAWDEETQSARFQFPELIVLKSQS